jgi:hypothetical protein
VNLEFEGFIDVFIAHESCPSMKRMGWSVISSLWYFKLYST